MRSLRGTLTLVLRSLLNRRTTALLTIASIAISVALLTAVDRVRSDTQASFANTISGTDLIVGARSGELNMLLYTVFRIGNPTNNVSWSSFTEIVERPEVAWAIPISLGDAHRGFRVLGTDARYFDYYRFADKRTLEFAAGDAFTESTDAVIGADVAAKLGYVIGDRIVVSHGIGATSFVEHDENPFTVTGVLARTGTPVDRTVHISLRGMELIHSDDPAAVSSPEFTPQAITAAFVGLESRISIFSLQRFINEYEEEPLMAVIPGVALQQLWGLIGIAEYALLGVSAMVVLAGALGLLTSLLVSLNERRREMAVLRSVGATPGNVFALLVAEAMVLALSGALLGLLLVQIAIAIAGPWITTTAGIQLSAGLRQFDVIVLVGIVAMAALVSFVPAWRAYRNSLADGLIARI